MADTADLLYTYQDAVDALSDYLGGNAAAQASRDIRRAILESYDELCGEKEWTHFTRPHFEQVYSPVTGTCSYSAGLFTIDSGTWPSWAEGATLSVGDVRYRISARSSSTTLTPVSDQAPVSDIAADTDFTIFKDIIRLPTTFLSMANPLGEGGNTLFAQYVTPERWLQLSRFSADSGQSVLWTIMADPVYKGRQALHVWPAPGVDGTIAFLGKFYPRSLKFTGHNTAERVGTVAVDATTLVATGTSTTFRADMIGSVMRISYDGTNSPEGPGGINPYQYQRFISAYSSGTSITLQGDALAANVSGRKYTISDPIDIARSMWDAFLRGAERRVANKKGVAAVSLAEQAYTVALRKAMAADSPSMSSRSCWDYSGGITLRYSGTQGGDA